MRILKYLFISLTFFSVFLVIALFGARELLLLLSLNQVKNSLNTLRKLEKQPGNYAQECINRGSGLTGSVIAGLQLRFISPTEYVLEVICTDFENNPQVVEQAKLPPFAKKLAGSTGVIWGDDVSGLVLEVSGRKEALVVQDRQVMYQSADANVSLGSGPISSCQAYGFSCCAQTTHQGAGDQYTGVNDCPKSCFQSCINRPVVLSFTSDPFMNLDTRTTTVPRNQAVTFSYLVDVQEVTDNEVVIDFGDGEQTKLDTAEGSTEHTYACSTTSCTYQARIWVTNAQGITSADLPVSVIGIIVN